MSDAKFELPFQFVNALRHARNRFEKHPHWKRLEGTPWENDASVIGADLMTDVARAYEARLAQLESVLAEAGEALEPFAECGNAWMKHASDGWPVFGGEESKTLVVIGDLRRAATVSAKIDEMDAALKEKTDEA